VCICLIIPRGKMALVRALHGRAAMDRVGAPWPVLGSSPRREEREEGKEEGGRSWGRCHGRAWGGASPTARAVALLVLLCTCSVVLLVREESREGERRREERKERKKERKKWENFLNLKILRKKNKKIIYEVGQKFFCKRKIYA
jgi:hypothetical protein